MSKQKLDAKTRTTTGKTAAKNLRKEGRIPAVVYNDKGEATSIDVSEVEFNKIWRTVTPTTSINLVVDGKDNVALIKDVEYNIRTDKVLHADFFVPAADQKLVSKIKIHYTGTPAGVPETIVADISGINVSEALRVKDLKVGKNVEVLTDAELPLVTVSPAR